MTIKPDNSNTGVQNDDHKTNKDFALLTIIVLLASIITILVLNHYFYNHDVKFIEMKFDKIGELGGVLQGTLGVAAALAGAYVAIKLAQIAINQAKKSNDIAARQARNDDPAYLEALKIRDNCNDLNGCIHSILLYTRQAVDASSRYTNAEYSFINARMNGDIDIDDITFQNELNNLRKMKNAVFQCFIGTWANEFSRLLISINPYILKSIEYRLTKDNHIKESTEWSNEPGVKWILSTYALQKNIMDLSENTGFDIPNYTLLEIMNGSEYLIEMLNVDETTKIEIIQTVLAKNDLQSMPLSIKNMLVNFKQSLVNLSSNEN